MSFTLQLRDRKIIFDRPAIMGILNVSPDSFSGDGIHSDIDVAVLRAHQMVEDGADIIDIGGESTRPGSRHISVEEELCRVLPVIMALVAKLDVPISIDTMKPEVAEVCLISGVHIINDVSGLRDEQMRQVAATYNAPAVVVHMQGTPQTMQDDPYYEHVVDEVIAYLLAASRCAKRDGVKQVIADPGIGFGKNLDHNLSLLRHLGRIREIVDYPLLVGCSRKGFIGAAVGGREVRDRLPGTLAAVTACVLNGADIVRVHDVKEARDAVRVAHAIKNAQ